MHFVDGVLLLRCREVVKGLHTKKSIKGIVGEWIVQPVFGDDSKVVTLGIQAPCRRSLSG